MFQFDMYVVKMLERFMKTATKIENQYNAKKAEERRFGD